MSAAFNELKQGLRSYLRRRLPDPTLADDLLQDVFVKALAARQSGRRVDNLTGWLYAAARTAVADHYRAQAAGLEELDDDLPAPEGDEERAHQDLACCLQRFVEKLPPLYRDTLLAAEFEGRTLKQIAEQEDVTLSAIKSRAARARQMLKELLLQCCHIEVGGGLVTEYKRRSRRKCCGA